MRFIRVLGWVSFGLGIVFFVLLFFRFGGSNVPKTRWRSQWGQSHWVTGREPGGQFLLDYPSDWDLSTPFERFTRRRLGGLFAVETLALRRGDPIGLFVVIRYVAPKSRPPEEWLKETRPGGVLAEQFGAHVLSRTPGRLAGVEGLSIVAEDKVREETYRFESWFLPDGDTAYRLTSAAPAARYSAVDKTLARIVASFRFVPRRGRPAAAGKPPVVRPASAAEN